MKDYVIVTDNTCDLDISYYKKHNIPFIVLPYSIDDTVYSDMESMTMKEFYDSMRGGKMPTTMAANLEDYENFFRTYLDKGLDVLYLCFSSALSSSYNNAMITASDLNDEYQNNCVMVLDTLAASMGEAVILAKAISLKNEGKSMEDVAEYIESYKHRVYHYFTVNDLFHLHRGGRVSKATAIVGTLINVKPILHVPGDGTLVSLCNVRGRKKALGALVDNFKEKTAGMTFGDDYEVMICHGDCIEDAEFVASKIKEECGIKNVTVSYASQTIGSHTGPGLVGIFFEGIERA